MTHAAGSGFASLARERFVAAGPLRVFAFAFSVALLGCDSRPVGPAKVKPGSQLRIISAAPNITEICCALGLRAQLVGRTRYCTYPPGIETVPSIGALLDVNVEALLDLRPDLILIAGRSRSITERLAPLGLRLESLPDDSLDDLFRSIRRIGELTGRGEGAERLCEKVRSELDAVDARYSGAAPARVLLLTATLSDPPTPPIVASPGSFYDDLIRRAGHTNIAAAGARSFVPLSLEFILHEDPDVILELDPTGRGRAHGAASAREVWSRIGPLRAVADRRVRVLSNLEFSVLGPRIARTYDAICRAVAEKSNE